VLPDVKISLRVGNALDHLTLMSDGTHLSNFAENNQEWPLYMTIGNLPLKLPQMPSMHSVVMVALLPIPIKNRHDPQQRLDEQRQTNREVLNEVIRQVFHPLTFEHNPSAESGFYNVLCADGNFRNCKPVSAALLADCPEYSDLHHLDRHVCAPCECPKNELGDYIPPDQQHPRQNHNLYRTLSDTETKAGDADLSSGHIH